MATELIPYSLEDIANEFYLDEDATEELLNCFRNFSMLEFVDNAWVILNWNKRQYKSDDSNERVTRFRQKQANIESETLQRRYSNADVTPPDTDTDTDTENREQRQKAEQPAAAAFTKFQNEIGMLTPKTSEIVGNWIDDYSDAWACDAIDEAVRNNARKPAYIDAILKRWKADGRNGRKAEKPYIPEEHASEVY